MVVISHDISAIIANSTMNYYSYDKINEALRLLDGRLNMNKRSSFLIVVCSGTTLNAMHLIQRTTKDVDIVALMDSHNQLIDPAPLPEELFVAVKEVADTLNLAQDGLNNGPSSDDGGLFRL